MENKQNSSANQGVGNIGNNVNTQKETNIRFHAAPSEKERDFGKEIDDLKKEFDKLKEKPPKKDGRIKRLLKDNWFIVGIIIILIGFDIFIHVPIIGIQSNYFAAIMGFVGILATFVVISNYAQVKEIENKFENAVKDLESKLETKMKEKIDERSHELGYIDTLRLMTVLSQESYSDMKIISLTFCLSDMNQLGRVKDSKILDLIQDAYDNKIFNESSIELLEKFCIELRNSLDDDSIMLNNIVGIYNSRKTQAE